jgi:hypothetical protein
MFLQRVFKVLRKYLLLNKQKNGRNLKWEYFIDRIQLKMWQKSCLKKQLVLKHFLKLSPTLTAVQIKQTRMSKQPTPFISEPSGIG